MRRQHRDGRAGSAGLARRHRRVLALGAAVVGPALLAAACTAADQRSADGDPFERALDGWHPGPEGWDDVLLTLYVEDDRLHLIAPTGSRIPVGEVVESGPDRVTLGPDPGCEPADEGGTYSVVRDGDELRFEPVGEDTCDGRQSMLTASPWRPTDLPPMTTEIPDAVPAEVVLQAPLARADRLRSAAGSIWAVRQLDGNLYRIDPGTGAMTTTRVGYPDRLKWLAVGDGALWVTDATRDVVHRVDPATGTAVAASPAGEDPDGVLAAGEVVWVVSHEAGTVSRLDPATGAVEIAARDLADPQTPLLLDGQVIVAVPEQSRMLRIDPQTLETATAYRGRLTGEVEVAPSGVWLVEGLSAEWVTRLGDDGAVAARIFVGTERWARSVAAAGDSVWVCTVGADWLEDAPLELLHVDAATDTVVARYDLGRPETEGCRLVVGDDGDVWVTTADDVVRVRPAAPG